MCIRDSLKTGTPPRIDGRSLDYSVMEEQPGDDPLPVISFIGYVSPVSYTHLDVYKRQPVYRVELSTDSMPWADAGRM